MADDRPRRPYPRPERNDRFERPGPPGQRPSFGPRPGPGQGPGGFVPRQDGFPPRTSFSGARPQPASSPEAAASIRVRDGDREVEVHGSPTFCRQVVDELPALLARIRAEAGGTPAAIALPPHPGNGASHHGPDNVRAAAPAARVAASTGAAATDADADADEDDAVTDLDEAVLAVVAGAGRPITIAEVRRRLPETTSGQQVRRILERAADRVVNSGGKPAAYRLRGA